jgi:hypothetical protein
VHYRGQLVTHAGALWQARKDCATEPGSPDSTQISRPGRDGVDGRSLRMKGLYNAGRTYEKFDVLLAGEPFMARHDAAGLCPSDGWMKLGARGAKGAKGEQGRRGPKGDAGQRSDVSIERRKVDPEYYRPTPVLTNGLVGRPLELRPIFEQFAAEMNLNR